MKMLHRMLVDQSPVGAPERRGDERSEAPRSGGSSAGEREVAPVPPDPEVPARHVRRRFTTAYKLEILRKVDACTRPGELGALLRREGLYSSHLVTCRRPNASPGISTASSRLCSPSCGPPTSTRPTGALNTPSAPPSSIARSVAGIGRPAAHGPNRSSRVWSAPRVNAMYIQGRGALRRELTACLRTGRALRVPRARRRGRGKAFVGPDILISARPAEVEDRAVPGHWEGDLIIGLGSSAIGTLVERTTRFTMLLHLPRLADRDHRRVKHGPALAGHGAEAVRDAITSTIATLPDQLRRSLTWDQGAEMAQHAQLRLDTGLHVFFCDPRSPWQRGTNENTNGLLRQYFPKGTDLNRHSARDIAAVAATLNRRPRKTLGWRTPSEAFNELLLSQQRGRVATTP